MDTKKENTPTVAATDRKGVIMTLMVLKAFKDERKDRQQGGMKSFTRVEMKDMEADGVAAQIVMSYPYGEGANPEDFKPMEYITVKVSRITISEWTKEISVVGEIIAGLTPKDKK